MRKITSLIALVLAFVMVLCACGGTANTDTTTGSVPTSGNKTTTGTNQTTTGTNQTTGGTVTPACAHDYTVNVIKQVTTEADGEVEYSCGKCGDKYKKQLPAVKSLKVLAIGNSFSVDAMEHLYTVAKAAGIEEVILGNLYIGGCSLDTHLSNIKNDAAAYEFYTNTNGEWKKEISSIDDALIEHEWSIVTIQQVSQDSGRPETFGALQQIIDHVNKNNLSDGLEIYWHMTWAYQQNSSHGGFSNYNRDQMTMYNAIVSTVQSKILTNSDIKGFIPSGTAVQNLRTSYHGDTLTRDGFHMSYGLGRYTAALMWLKYLTGLDISDIATVPAEYPDIIEHLPAIKEAVNNAYKNPLKVTESTHKEYVNELLIMTEADKAYLTSLGLNPADYEVLDLGLKFSSYWLSTNAKTTLVTTASNSSQFIATKIFNSQTLPVGSVIKIADGFQYRPEGWVKLSTANSLGRPDNMTEGMIVDEEFFSTFNFRAFNVSHVAVDGVTANAVYDDRTALRIFVPKTEAPSNEMTDADREYLTGIGLNPDNYVKVDLGYTLFGYYNSTSGTTSTLICLENGSVANNLHNFVGTRIIQKSEIPVGSVIRVDEGFQYRPEKFIALGAKPAARGNNTTTPYIIVNDAWWGAHNYVGFNVAVQGGTATVSMETGDHFVIYALKEGAQAPDTGEVPEGPKVINSKVADEVFAGHGYDASKYTKIELTKTIRAYYNSTDSTSIILDRSNCPQFWTTQVFDKADLPNGTVIVIGMGYQYRPDGWQSMSSTNSGSRPGNVLGSGENQIVVINDAWWGDFNHRAFNVAVEGNSINVTEADYVTFAIYVPKA